MTNVKNLVTLSLWVIAQEASRQSGVEITAAAEITWKHKCVLILSFVVIKFAPLLFFNVILVCTKELYNTVLYIRAVK